MSRRGDGIVRRGRVVRLLRAKATEGWTAVGGGDGAAPCASEESDVAGGWGGKQ